MKKKKYTNDNKSIYHPDLSIVAIRFTVTIYWFEYLNIKPIYLIPFNTCKDLRIAFKTDMEGTFLTLKRLPNVGDKTIWNLYNFINQ